MSLFRTMTSLRERFSEIKESWMVIWLLFSLPIGYLLLFSQDINLFWLIAGQCAMAIVLHFLVIPRVLLTKLLFAFLILGSTLSIIGWYFGSQSFRATDHFWKQLVQLSPHEIFERQGSQSWNLNSKDDLVWTLEARQVAGFSDWDWGRSDPGFELERLQDESGVYTQVITPEGLDEKAHISQNYFLDGALSERTFKFSLETRFLNAPEDAKPFIMASGGREFVLPISSEWSVIERPWTVQANQGSELRLILMGLEGTTIDVRKPKVLEFIEGEWVDLGPSIGTGVRLRADNAGLIIYKGFLPSEDWKTYSLDITSENLDLTKPLITKIDLDEGLSLQIRNSEVANETQDQASLNWRNIRQKLWFPNENLAGHSYATAGLALLTLTSSFASALGAFLVLIIAVVITGSRTALLVALLGGLVLLGLKVNKKQRLLYILGSSSVLIILVLGLYFVLSYPIVTRVLSLDQEISRLLIWRTALAASFEYPFGVPNHDFTAFFALQHPNLPQIEHAHNFWLDFAARYGIIGLLSSLILSVSMIYIVWKYSKGKGFIFILSIFVLQLLDFTLFYNIIFITVLLGINQLEPKRNVT